MSNNQDFAHCTNTANGFDDRAVATDGTGTDNAEVIADGGDSSQRYPVRQRNSVVRLEAGMIALEEYDTPKILAEAHSLPHGRL